VTLPEDPQAARLAAETLQALAAVELDAGEAEVAARLRGAAQTVLVEGDTELSQRALEFDYDLLVNLEETLGKEKVEEEWAAGREEGTAALDLESAKRAGTNGRRPAGGPTSIVV
jgi:uncharacterized membrane protein YqiK